MVHHKTGNWSKRGCEIGSVTITDKQRIADGFNKYFVNVETTLANKIPHQNISPEHYLLKRKFYDFFLNLNPVNLMSLVHSLSKTVSHDLIMLEQIS